MADMIHVDIVTPEKVLFSESADMVTAPGSMGEFGILPGHAAFVTTLDHGDVSVKRGGSEQRFTITGGFAEVDKDKLIILADAVEEK